MEISEQDALYVFSEFDKNRQGLINYEDFMARILVIISILFVNIFRET